MNDINKLIVLLGPTASGKSELAIKLARFLNGEIISADSRQIYRGLDIGTNKDKKHKQYLIDIVKPNQRFTVAQFKKKAIKIIKEIQKRGKIPFLVGGTGLYIQSVTDNLEIPRVPPDRKLRNKLEKQIKKNGLNWGWKKLIKLDPGAKKFVQKQNSRRIIRALEVCLKTKKRFSELRKIGQPLFNILQIGIKVPRQALYQRIDERVEKMIKNGLVDEVRILLRKYSPTLPSMSGIGYKEIASYFDGKIDLEDAIDEIKKNTRRFSRRQMTWFKRDKEIIWEKDYSKIKRLVEDFLER